MSELDVIAAQAQSRPPMNHTPFRIVLLAGNRDDAVTPLMISNRRGE